MAEPHHPEWTRRTGTGRQVVLTDGVSNVME
jgi:hypothetical protein